MPHSPQSSLASPYCHANYRGAFRQMENSGSQLFGEQTAALPVPKRLEIHGRSIGGGTAMALHYLREHGRLC